MSQDHICRKNCKYGCQMLSKSELFKFYSKRNTVPACKVWIKSKSRYYFECRCGHTIRRRISDYGKPCHFCSNPCDNENCEKCVDKFINAIPRILESMPNPEKKITKTSDDNYDFICANCRLGIYIRPRRAVIYGICIECKFASICNTLGCEICWKVYRHGNENYTQIMTSYTFENRKIIGHTEKNTYKYDTDIRVNHVYVCKLGHKYYDNINNLSGCPGCQNRTLINPVYRPQTCI